MKCVLAVWCAASLAGLFLASAGPAGRRAGAGESSAPAAGGTEEDRKLFAEIKPLILQEGRKPPILLADTNEGYFWLMSAQITPLVRAYEYSKDPEFLEVFVPLMEQVLTQRYIHPTKKEWNGWWHYKGFNVDNTFALIDHDTILYYVPVLLFAAEVRADPKLKEKYGAKAEAWFKDVEESIRAWDKRGCWHDLDEKTGWYSNTSEYPDKNTNELVKHTDIFAGGTVPYNKINAFYEALTLAYRLTGDDWYRVRMEKSAKFWRDRWREDDKHVEWNYRDHAFAGDYKSGVLGQGATLTGAFVHPKGGYYALDLEGVVMDYDLGVLYQRADLEKLLKTNLEFMLFGDEKAPKFKMISGDYKEGGKYNKGYLWTALAHFSPKVRDLWKQQIDRDHGKAWLSWAAEIDYLTEVAQPVSWDRRDAKAP